MHAFENIEFEQNSEGTCLEYLDEMQRNEIQ